MTIFIGVDPGLRSGSLGAIDHNGTFLMCADIPAEGERINVRAFKRLLDEATGRWVLPEDAQIVIEDVFVRPGQGISSTGKFMRAAGALEAVCLLKATTHIVSPQKWKKDMGLTSDKEASLQLAREMWPDAMSVLERKKDHNKCEALLLAEWLRRTFE